MEAGEIKQTLIGNQELKYLGDVLLNEIDKHEELLEEYHEKIEYLSLEIWFTILITDRSKLMGFKAHNTFEKYYKKAIKGKDEQKKIGKNYTKLTIYDFNSFDTLQKRLVTEYLTSFYTFHNILEGITDVSVAFLVINALQKLNIIKKYFNEYSSYSKDNLFSMYHVDILSYVIPLLSSLSAQIKEIKILYNLNKDNVIKVIGSEVGFLNIDKRWMEKNKNYIEALKLWKNEYYNKNNELLEDQAADIADIINELVDKAPTTEIEREFEQQYDEKKAAKAYDRYYQVASEKIAEKMENISIKDDPTSEFIKIVKEEAQKDYVAEALTERKISEKRLCGQLKILQDHFDHLLKMDESKSEAKQKAN